MSEQESSACEICGGVKRINWTISFEECRPVEMRFDPASLAGNWRICPGHPEPISKHDGVLERFVRRDEGWESVFEQVEVEITNRKAVYLCKEGQDDLVISTKQALSLLDWLLQERDELARLAKEQGE